MVLAFVASLLVDHDDLTNDALVPFGGLVLGSASVMLGIGLLGA